MRYSADIPELNAMLLTSKNENNNTAYGWNWVNMNLVADRMFILSTEEATNYLGNYDGASALKSNVDWWLRHTLLT